MRSIKESSRWSFDLIDFFIIQRINFITVGTFFQGGLINEHFLAGSN